jgi:anti-sigma factor ChrR (cupin superfamily)
MTKNEENVMEDIYINFEEMEWKKANGYPSGTMIKVLYEDTEPKTFILKLPKNTCLEAHSHTATEQHFVLDGEYISNDKAYRKGSYRFIPARVTHDPFTSEDGAMILVIRETK